MPSGFAACHALRKRTYTGVHRTWTPQKLTEAQSAQLSELTRDLPETDKVVRSGADGTVEVTPPMNSNDIILVKLWRNKAAR